MKKVCFSIKWEILLIFILLIIIIISGISLTVTTLYKKSFIKEVEQRGDAITKSIANNIADFLLVKYDLETAKILKDTLSNNGVKYALVTDKNFRIIAHNDMTKVKDKFEIKNVIYTGKYLLYKDDLNEKIMDFSYPVIAKNKINLGTLHIGISYEIIENEIKKIYLNILLIAVIAILLGILLTYIVSINITRPIKKLVNAAEIIGGGNFDFKIDIKKFNEIGILADAFNKMTYDLKIARQNELKRVALEKELEIAKKLQESILPQRFPGMYNYEVTAFYKPAKQIGGDYYDVISLGDNKFAILVADVAGKGIPAALLMTMLSGIANIKIRENKNIKDIIAEINDELLLKITESIFVTMFFGILDTEKNSMEIIFAGHNEGLFYLKNKLEIICLKGVALGFLDGKVLKDKLESKTIDIEKDDKILLYTDGVIDAKNEKGERFGLKKLKNIFEKNILKTGKGIINAILDEINNFNYNCEPEDDIALLLLERKK